LTYAEKDPRIRVYNNEHFVPIIANHNIALRQILPKSKYCKVVFADDVLFPTCLENMVQLAENHPSVAIVGSYSLYGPGITGVGLPYSESVVTGRDACRMSLLGGPYVFGTATSVLYRADIVRSRYAFYNESNLHADAEVCYEFLEHRDFGFVHQILSYLRYRENSNTSHSQRLQTYLPAMIYHLTGYGPKYLTEAEMNTRRREVFRNYYRYLGSQVYKLRDHKFWDFHRGQLASCGYSLSASRLITAATSYLFDKLLNPKRTLEAVFHTLKSKAYCGDHE
jgi:hypothetical protein